MSKLSVIFFHEEATIKFLSQTLLIKHPVFITGSKLAPLYSCHLPDMKYLQWTLVFNSIKANWYCPLEL